MEKDKLLSRKHTVLRIDGSLSMYKLRFRAKSGREMGTFAILTRVGCSGLPLSFQGCKLRPCYLPGPGACRSLRVKLEICWASFHPWKNNLSLLSSTHTVA